MAAVAPARGADGEPLLSIGQVLTRLSVDFAELSPSKLRFLEEQGLMTPARTKSGYRKFSQADIERLRLILTLQRDHYLPLKVISEFLDDVDCGKNPEIPGVAPKTAATLMSPRRVLTRAELLRESGASASLLAEAISAQLVPALDVFPQHALDTMRTLRGLGERGIAPRHLRAMRLAAERDAELIEQSLAARGGAGGQRSEDALELAAMVDQVRSSVLRARLLG